MAGLADVKMQRNQSEDAIHYIMCAHVRPYRPRGPCARMKYALSHKFEVMGCDYLATCLVSMPQPLKKLKIGHLR